VFPLLNDFARVPICGQVAHYNDVDLPRGRDRLPGLMDTILAKRLKIQGFMVYDFDGEAPAIRSEMASWLRSGEIINQEDITDGLENAPSRFIGMLKGKNFGKTLIKVNT
jgi:NADPH-dependent curcumin reductase CurA